MCCQINSLQFIKKKMENLIIFPFPFTFSASSLSPYLSYFPSTLPYSSIEGNAAILLSITSLKLQFR